MLNRSGSMVLILLLQFMPCTSVAQVPFSTGLTFLDENTYRSVPLATTPLLGELPALVDMTSNFPQPGSQGRQASCVGWAVAYALKSFQEKTERKWALTSQDHLFSPAFIYNQIRRSSDCQGGTLFTDALNVLRRDGVASLSAFPYDERVCHAIPDQATKQAARQYAVADWRRVNVQDETEIRTQIASGFPILIGMIVDQEFMDLRGDRVYTGQGVQSLGGHAMVVVGYQDSRRAFKVINSWGQTWGDRGYGWIGYDAFRRTVREGYVVQDIVLNRPDVAPAPPPAPPGPLTPPPSPSVPSIALGTPTVQHNVQVPIPAGFGFAPGLQISVPGTVTGAAGRNLQIVVKFSYFNGPPLFANPQEPRYRDVSGLVATGTPPIVVGSNSENLGNVNITIPYYALNFPPTNGAAVLQLSLTAMAYVDNQLASQSGSVPFTLRW